jgi:DNA end-binding protein Ku
MLDTGLSDRLVLSAQSTSLLRPFHEGLIMHQLRYADEVAVTESIPIAGAQACRDRPAKQIIQQIAHETFTPEKYKDEVQARMVELIQKKVEGQEITIAPEAPAGKVIDLMEALKQSLGMAASDSKPAKAAAEPAKEEPKKKTASKKK